MNEGALRAAERGRARVLDDDRPRRAASLQPFPSPRSVGVRPFQAHTAVSHTITLHTLHSVSQRSPSRPSTPRGNLPLLAPLSAVGSAAAAGRFCSSPLASPASQLCQLVDDMDYNYTWDNGHVMLSCSVCGEVVDQAALLSHRRDCAPLNSDIQPLPSHCLARSRSVSPRHLSRGHSMFGSSSYDPPMFSPLGPPPPPPAPAAATAVPHSGPLSSSTFPMPCKLESINSNTSLSHSLPPLGASRAEEPLENPSSATWPPPMQQHHHQHHQQQQHAVPIEPLAGPFPRANWTPQPASDYTPTPRRYNGSYMYAAEDKTSSQALTAAANIAAPSGLASQLQQPAHPVPPPPPQVQQQHSTVRHLKRISAPDALPTFGAVVPTSTPPQRRQSLPGIARPVGRQQHQHQQARAGHSRSGSSRRSAARSPGEGNASPSNVAACNKHGPGQLFHKLGDVYRCVGLIEVPSSVTEQQKVEHGLTADSVTFSMHVLQRCGGSSTKRYRKHMYLPDCDCNVTPFRSKLDVASHMLSSKHQQPICDRCNELFLSYQARNSHRARCPKPS